MKKIRFLIPMAITVLSLSACGNSSGQSSAHKKHSIDDYINENGEIVIDEKVTIDFWGWGGQAEQDIYHNMSKVFMAQNPNITVNYTGYRSDIYMENLTNSVLHLPDVFYMPDTEFYRWADSGNLWEYGKYVTANELSAIWEDGYERYYYDTTTRTVGKSANAGLYGLPKDIGPFQMCYNEDLLKKACEYSALNYDNIKAEYLNETNPITWTKFIELGNLLKPYCDINQKKVLSHYELYSALYSNNADFVSDDGRTSRIEEPQFAAALDFMHSLAFDYGLMAGSSGSTTTTGYNSFIGKISIFSFLGPWDCATLWGTTPASPNAFSASVKLVPVPYGPGADGVYGNDDDGVSTCQIGSMGYSISNRDTTSDVQRAASLKFAKWLCYNQDTQKELYKLGQQLPNIKTMATTDYVAFGSQTVKSYSGVEAPVNPSNLSVFIDVVNGTSATDKVTGRQRTQCRTYSSTWKDDWGTAVSKYQFWNNASATGAGLVASFKDTLQARLNEYNKALGH